MKVGFGLAYHAAVVTRGRSRVGRRLASSVTIENSASRQGVVRAMALSDHCRCVSTPRCARASQDSDLDIPAPHEPRHDLYRLTIEVSAEQSLRREAVLGIAHQHPSDRHDR
jgi:hypothetical protein